MNSNPKSGMREIIPQKSNPPPRKDYEEYERRKAALPVDLTQAEYDQAVQQILLELEL